MPNGETIILRNGDVVIARSPPDPADCQIIQRGTPPAMDTGGGEGMPVDSLSLSLSL